MSEDDLPVVHNGPRRIAPSLLDVDGVVVEITIYDTNDIAVERQYRYLMVDDADKERFLVTDFAMPISTD